MNYLMRIANPYIYMCRIANPTQRPALRTSPRTDGTWSHLGAGAGGEDGRFFFVKCLVYGIFFVIFAVAKGLANPC